MRRGSWILAITGWMTLPASTGLAADPFAQPTPAAPAAAASRYQLRPASAPKASERPANYYNELFGGSAPTEPKTAVAPKSTAPFSAPPVAKTATAPAKPVADPFAEADPFATDDPFASKTAAAPIKPGMPAAQATSAPVQQAAFDEQPGTSPRQYIQQIRVERPATAPVITPSLAAGTVLPSVKSSAAAAESSRVAPQVSLEWIKDTEINIGQECELKLVVKNTGSSPAADVEVSAFFPTTVRLTHADPKPAQATDRVIWQMALMAPGEQQTLKVKLIPSRRGDLGTTAHVRFTGVAGANFRVEEPMLKVALKAPSSVMLGDPIAQLITISNPGTGPAHNVKLDAVLSEGLEHTRGNRIEMEIGSINAGETRTVRLGLAAVKGGKQNVTVTATSSSELSNVASNELEVVAPSLKIVAKGPGLRYKGRAAKYEIIVTNDGSVANNNVRVSQTIAKGFQFVSADRGGKFDDTQNSIHWFVGRLEPQQSLTVVCELMAVELGDFTHAVQVASDSGVRGDTSVQTKVEGASSLSMEVVDLDDPVELGVETVYEIRLKNDGTKSATNVAIACELPPELQLLNATGPTSVGAQDRMIVFKAIPELAAGQSVAYRVHVKTAKEGNHRIRVKMSSDSIQEPLILEEQTKFYADTRK